jgi:hypothetical protein
MKMNKIAIAIITAVLLIGCVASSGADISPITGITIDNSLACRVSDLSEGSKDRIILWWTLNRKNKDGTLTQEEAALGSMLEMTGQCHRMIGGVPVTLVQTDGTMYLGKWPDGTLFGFTDGTVLLDEEYR